MKNVLKRTLAIFLTIVMTIGIAPLSGFVGLKFPELKLPDWFDFSVESEAATVPASAQEIKLDDRVSLSLKPAQKFYFKFIPEVTGIYRFTSYYVDGTHGYFSVYDYDMSSLESSGGTSFTVEYTFTAGETYYFELYFYSSSYSGLFDIGLSCAHSYATDGIFCDYCGKCAYEYEINNNEVKITGCDTTASDAMIIPSTIEGYPVVEIGEYAFKNCKNLSDITFSENLVTIGKGAFAGTLIRTVTIPNSVTTICDEAFKGCGMVTGVKLGSGIQHIGDYAFSGTYIKYIVLPASVKSIGAYSFSNCSRMTIAKTGNGLTDIGDYAFCDSYLLEELTIGTNVKNIGKGAFDNCNNIKSITLSSNNKYFSLDESGSLYDKNKTEIIYYLKNSEVETFEIPDSVTCIREKAFYKSDLKSITVPSGMEFIESDAFLNCSSLKNVYFKGDISDWCKINFANANANPTYYGNNLYFGDNLATEVVIPESVTSIGAYTFCNCKNITSVILPENLTSIDENAFYGCENFSVTVAGPNEYYSNDEFGNLYNKDKTELIRYNTENPLSSFVVPDSVVRIGSYAFNNCTALTSIVIGDNVTTVEDYAFNGCSSIIDFTVPVSTVFGKTNKLNIEKLILTKGTGVMPDYSYDTSPWYKSSVKEIILNDGITNIGNYAFSNCSNLTSVEIPDSVTIIGKNAFYYCDDLNSIVIPDSVMSIDGAAFGSCKNLVLVGYWGEEEDWNKISIDSSNNTYLTNAIKLYNTKYIGTTVVDGIKYIYGDTEAMVLSCTEPATSVILPKEIEGRELKGIALSAFKNCTGLTSIEIPDSAETIGDYAFSGCTGLTSIEISDSTVTIGNYAFSGCTGLTSIEISDSTVTIGNYAFSGCTGLTSIEIPDSAETIGDYAFSDCSALSSITIPDSVTTIGSYVFENCTNLTSVVIPDSVTNFGKRVFSNCTNLMYAEINGVGELDSDTFYKCKNLESVNIGDGFTDITTYTFDENFSKLTDVVIGKGVKHIEIYSFFKCPLLKNITICSGISNIEGNAFYECKALKNVYFNGSESDWWNIDFENEYSNPMKYADNLYFNGKIVTEIEIPYGVEKLDSVAPIVGLTKLEKITIPASVKSIKRDFFYDYTCLNDVYFNGSESDWWNIDFENKYSNPMVHAGNLYFNGELVTEIEIPHGIENLDTVLPIIGLVCVEKITIPDSIVSIGKDFFKDFTHLTDVYYNGDATSWLAINFINDYSNPMVYADNLYFKDKLVTVFEIPYGIEVLNADTRKILLSFSDIIIPDSVKSIDANAFKDCSNLTSITIPDSVTSIGDSAFYGCSGLTSITIPDSVTSIGESVFEGCSGITEATIGNGVTTIPYNAFNGCRNLYKCVLGNQVESIGNFAFRDCPKLVYLTIPRSKITFGDYVFYDFEGVEKPFIYVNYGGSVNDWLALQYNNPALEKTSVVNFNPDIEVISNDKSDFTYEIVNDEVIITKYVGSSSTVIIPDTIDGKPVTVIDGYAFSKDENITTVYIPDSVVTIGYRAFYYCSNMKRIFMGKNVKEINSRAFDTCIGLKSIKIPDAVTEIKDKAFYDCRSLADVYMPTSVTRIEDGAFYYCYHLENIYYEGTKKQWNNIEIIDTCSYLFFEYATIHYLGDLKNKPQSVFKYRNIDGYMIEITGYTGKATDIEIPTYIDGYEVVSIADSAFIGRSDLKSVNISASFIETIGENAFKGCTGLTSVTLPREIMEIKDSAFEGCSSISEITISGSYLGDNVFKNCTGLKTATINTYEIGENAFYGCTGLETVNIGENVRAIETRAFYKCTSLKEIVIPSTVRTMMSEVFAECTGLTKADINCSCNIENNTFSNCYSLKEVVVGSGVKSIGFDAFSDCIALEKISLNCSGAIEMEAFKGCTSLKEVTIENGVTEIGNEAFSGCVSLEKISINCSGGIETEAFKGCTSLKEVIIENSVTEIGHNAFGDCTSLEKININCSGPIKDSAFFDCKSLKSVVIGNDVTEIGSSAFFGCDLLEEVDVNCSGIIGDNAFAMCNSLKSVVIGDNVTGLGSFAFDGCNSLETISIGKGLVNLDVYAFESGIMELEYIIVDEENEFFSSDENGVLYNKDKTVLIKYPAGKLEHSFKIPEQVETLATFSFADCSFLETLYMPINVKHIMEDAFEANFFMDIYYNGYNYDWRKIEMSGYDDIKLVRVHFLGFVITDEETDVEIEYDDEYDGEVDLEVDKIPDDGQIMLTNDQKEKTNAVIYDISTLKDGMTVQPNGKIKVRIPAPENYTNSKIFVFYIDNTINGREWIPARIIDGYVVFEVDHFSLYAVADLDFTFSINETEAYLTGENNTVQLSAIIDSEIAINGYTVQWKSSDESVAVVDENGLVTRVGNGKCTITATFNDDETKIATCSIVSSGGKQMVENLKLLRGTASIKSYKGEEYVAITMASGKTMTGLYKDMVDGGTVELIDICGTIQDRAGDYVAYQSQNKTNPVATMKVTNADGTVETYPVVFELYEMEREIDFDPTTKIRPIRGKVSLATDAKGDYILVEMLDGQSSVGVYKSTTDGSTTATLDGAEGMFTEQEKLYIFYGSQNTFNPEGRLTVTEEDGSQKTYRIVFKMYEMDPYVNVAKGLRPVRGAVTFDADGTIRIKMTSGQKSVGLYKTMANGATFKIVDANGRMTNNPSSVMFYMTNNPANVTATMIFTLPDGTTKEQKIIFDMGLEDNPDPLVYLTAVRGTVSYQNDGTEDYIEVKANALSSGVGLNKDCLVKYTITDVEGIMTENNTRYYIYKSQNPDGLSANINFLQSDGSYKTYKVKFVF